MNEQMKACTKVRMADGDSECRIVRVDKCTTMKISVVMCTDDLVGQGRLTTILTKVTIPISVIRSARKMIIFLFHTFFG